MFILSVQVGVMAAHINSQEVTSNNQPLLGLEWAIKYMKQHSILVAVNNICTVQYVIW